MWDIIVGIITYLAKALGHSREKPERLFRDHIEPIQQDLLIVQKDYVQTFLKIAEMIADEEVPMPDIVRHVRRERLRFNPVRTGAVEQAQALNKYHSSRAQRKPAPPDSPERLLQEYADAVVDYLYNSLPRLEVPDGGEAQDLPESFDVTEGTRYSDFLKLVEAIQAQTDERARLAKVVEETEEELERSWHIIAQRYAVLRAKCL